MKRRRSYDYEDAQPPRDTAAIIWSLLSVLMLLGVACVGFVFVLIYTNPRISINPFPPPTSAAAALVNLATPTSAIITLPPSWTPTETTPPTETITPTPTNTLAPTPTPIMLTATPNPTATEVPTPSGGFPYEVRQGSPKAIPNIYHPEESCNGMWVGGQVLDLRDGPVTGLMVRLGGRLPGLTIDDTMFTLTGVASSYGRSGYEFRLANAPIPSREALWVQLIGQSGVPLSARIVFSTTGDCEQNQIIIDFKQVR